MLELKLHDPENNKEYNFESVYLGMFTIQTAASVIEALKTMPVEPTETPNHGIGGLIDINYDHHMAPHGYRNALLSHVKFLYEYVKLATQTSHPNFCFEPRNMIADALFKYQKYEAEVLKRQNFKIDTPNWTEYNKAFLEGEVYESTK